MECQNIELLHVTATVWLHTTIGHPDWSLNTTGKSMIG